LAAGNRRAQLDDWLREQLPPRFEGRVLAIDFEVADECGRLLARREAKGRPIHAMDALIAATAQVHGLTVVSRNIADLKSSVKSILNPWT
jgi:predicted nucleic acid-binding protein